MPFYWVGALFSAVFLTTVIAIFGVVLKIGNRAATEVRESILPGLVVGIRAWAGDDGCEGQRIISPRAVEGGASIEETPATGVRLEHVRRAS